MTPTPADRERAAQIWCEPQHAHKVMDPDLAESIAQALAAQREADAKIAEDRSNLDMVGGSTGNAMGTAIRIAKQIRGGP